jgi:hypothetical protein
VDGDFGELLGGIAETFGLGELIRGALRGPAAYANGRSTQTGDDGDANLPYVYERLLTRPRDPGINDR